MTTTEAGLSVGEKAPDLKLRTPDGTELQLSTVWSKKPTAVVFLGALESAFASEYAILWRDADEHIREAGGEIVCVCGAPPGEAEAFRERWNLSYPLLCDYGPGYAAFGVSGSQPGSFVIDPEGTLIYVHRNQNDLDNPPTWDLIDAVSELTGKTIERPEPVPIGEEAEMAQIAAGVAQGALAAGGQTALPYNCAKCGHHDYEILDVSSTSGMMSRLVNLQNRRFSAVVCGRCKYTEFYRTESGTLRNVFDFLVGS